MSDFSVHLISSREALSNKLCKNSEQQIVAEDKFIPYTLEDQEKYSGKIHLKPSLHHDDNNYENNNENDLETYNIKEIAENVLNDRRQAVEEVGKSVFELHRLVNLTQSIKNNEHLTIEICPALDLPDDPLLPASQRIKRMQDVIKKGKELISQGQNQAKLACLQRRKYIKDCESLKSSSWRLVNVPAPMWAETTAQIDKQEVSAGDLIGIDCSFINNENIKKKNQHEKMTQIAKKKARLFATASVVPLFITENGASPSPSSLLNEKMKEKENDFTDMLVLLAKVVTNDGHLVASHSLSLDIVRSFATDNDEMKVYDNNNINNNNSSSGSSNGSRINEFLQHRQLHILSNHLLKELLISGAKFADSFTTPVVQTSSSSSSSSSSSEVLHNLHRTPLKGRLEILALQARTRQEQLTIVISDQLSLVLSLVRQSEVTAYNNNNNNNSDITSNSDEIEMNRALEMALLQTCCAVLEKWKKQTNILLNKNTDSNNKDEKIHTNDDEDEDDNDDSEGIVQTDPTLRGDMMIFPRRGADGARGGVSRSGQIATVAVLRTHFQMRLMRHLLHSSWLKLGDILSGSFTTSGNTGARVDFIELFWQPTNINTSTNTSMSIQTSSKVLVGQVRLDGTFGRYELWQSQSDKNENENELVFSSMHLSAIMTSLLHYLAGSFMNAAGATPLLGGSSNSRSSAALWDFQGQTVGLTITLPESLNLHTSGSTSKPTFSICVRSDENKNEQKVRKHEKNENNKKRSPLISIKKLVKWTDMASMHTFLASRTTNSNMKDAQQYPFNL